MQKEYFHMLLCPKKPFRLWTSHVGNVISDYIKVQEMEL